MKTARKGPVGWGEMFPNPNLAQSVGDEVTVGTPPLMGSAIIILTVGDSPQGSESKGHRARRGRRKVTQDEDGVNFS